MNEYLKDLISIPDRVHQGDFVLKLTEGVEDAAGTLGSYVVTPQLVGAFDDALGFIRSALDSNSSKATYLDGSFGSGKSHFMAVLHLLLHHDETARGLPELAEVVQRHNEWLRSRRFLLVPYHMTGHANLESAVLGNYADHVRALHPEAPIPAVFLTESLFENARQLRSQMGDEAFFAALSADGGGGDKDGWGELAGWDVASFEAALEAPRGEGSPRERLVGDLLEHLLPAFRTHASSRGEAFLSLDDGLSVISRHARDLGYDAVVLFLDELILWLAGYAAEPAKLGREGQKVAKLVESQNPNRPIPLISFVARQRDLRELVGEHVSGAEQLGFADSLKYWEARFHSIKLEDRNLPAIVERRLLAPKSQEARLRLDEAFETCLRLRPKVLEILLTREADREMFRRLYPFSPALIQTLVAVSGALQRERTAIRALLQLLVRHRERLRPGDLVPVGDLYDILARGDEPFTKAMRVHFDKAKRLYRGKLQPMLQRQHGLVGDPDELPWEDEKRTAFRRDDRLIKTLLLAALVPEVETLKVLDGERLSALNPRSVRSPIPGREAGMVVSKLRTWAGEVGEIRLSGTSENPTATIQLTGVDTEAILAKAEAEDRPGERQRTLREILFREIGVDPSVSHGAEHRFLWRGTPRRALVEFRNVREMPAEELANGSQTWRVVIDFPFDAETFTPRDDVAKVEEFRALGRSARTLVWLPLFFSRRMQKDLGTLVRLNHVLTGERFEDFASHLSAVDRAAARATLENQQSALGQQVLGALLAAYGVEKAEPGVLDESHSLDSHVYSLRPEFEPRPPVGAGLEAAFEDLVGQALGEQFPVHPDFQQELRPATLRQVQELVVDALGQPQGRGAVERTRRPLMAQIAQPLRLGTMHETHFLVDRHWQEHFEQHAAREAGQGEGTPPMTVERLRRWIDEPRGWGLPRQAQDLILLCFAEQSHRAFYLAGDQPAPAEIGKLHDDLELRVQDLPSEGVWEEARSRAGSLFGFAVSPLLNPSNVRKLVQRLEEKARDHRAPCDHLVEALRAARRHVGAEDRPWRRLETAEASLALMEALRRAEGSRLLEVLCEAELCTSAPAMSTSTDRAAVVTATLQTTPWDLFEGLRRLNGERREAAGEVLEAACSALAQDEYATELGPALATRLREAVRLLTPVQPSSPPLEETAPVAPETVSPEATRLAGGQARGHGVREARRLLEEISRTLEEHEGEDGALRLELSWTLVREAAAPSDREGS